RHATLRHLPSFPTRRSSDLSDYLMGRIMDEYARCRRQTVDAISHATVERQHVGRHGVLLHDSRCGELLSQQQGEGVVVFALRQHDRKSTRLNSSHVKISYAV